MGESPLQMRDPKLEGHPYVGGVRLLGVKGKTILAWTL
jgi:hypothetical protein